MNEWGDVGLTVVGAFNQGLLMNAADFSNEFMTSGGIIIPGTAMPILDGITWQIAAIAAALLKPASFPSSVSIVIPFTISCWRYNQ